MLLHYLKSQISVCSLYIICNELGFSDASLFVMLTFKWHFQIRSHNCFHWGGFFCRIMSICPFVALYRRHIVKQFARSFVLSYLIKSCHVLTSCVSWFQLCRAEKQIGTSKSAALVVRITNLMLTTTNCSLVSCLYKSILNCLIVDCIYIY